MPAAESPTDLILVMRFNQFINQPRCGCKPYPLFLSTSRDTKARSQMCLARSTFSDQDDRLRSPNVCPRGQVMNLWSRQLGRLCKIKLLQCLHPWEVGFANPSLNGAMFPIFHFRRQQCFEITHMTLLLPHGFFGHLSKLHADGRHAKDLAVLTNAGFL
jgi:hypothetical protein